MPRFGTRTLRNWHSPYSYHSCLNQPTTQASVAEAGDFWESTDYNRAYSYPEPGPRHQQRHPIPDSALMGLICGWLFQCPGMWSWPRSHLPKQRRP
ncbi:unnamed protein product [Prunus brigantina]